MKAVALPGLAYPLPQLVLGTMTFGDTADSDTAREMVTTALNAGITSFDTANGYASGRSEEMLGQLLAGRRDQITIGTKAGIYTGDAGGASLLSRDGLRRSLAASLRRLGTDFVDIFYLHQPDRSVEIQETVDTLATFVREGSIRAIGVSNYAAWQIGDVLAACERAGAPQPILAQQLYNLVARRIESEYVDFSIARSLGTIVYNPLGGGVLSGRHTFASAPTEGRFGSSALSSMYRDRYWNKPMFEAVEALKQIAGQAGLTLPEMSLRWLLSRPVVTSILLGGSRPEQLRSNIAAAEKGPLDKDLIDACDRVGEALAGPMPAYNR